MKDWVTSQNDKKNKTIQSVTQIKISAHTSDFIKNFNSIKRDMRGISLSADNIDQVTNKLCEASSIFQNLQKSQKTSISLLNNLDNQFNDVFQHLQENSIKRDDHPTISFNSLHKLSSMALIGFDLNKSDALSMMEALRDVMDVLQSSIDTQDLKHLEINKQLELIDKISSGECVTNEELKSKTLMRNLSCQRIDISAALQDSDTESISLQQVDQSSFLQQHNSHSIADIQSMTTVNSLYYEESLNDETHEAHKPIPPTKKIHLRKHEIIQMTDSDSDFYDDTESAIFNECYQSSSSHTESGNSANGSGTITSNSTISYNEHYFDDKSCNINLSKNVYSDTTTALSEINAIIPHLSSNKLSIKEQINFQLLKEDFTIKPRVRFNFADI